MSRACGTERLRWVVHSVQLCNMAYLSPRDIWSLPAVLKGTGGSGDCSACRLL
jgi:hypothetical protein